MRRFPQLLLALMVLGAGPDVHALPPETSDSLGTDYRLIPAGRYLRGMEGGERRLETDFPQMASGQYFGNAERPAHFTWITKPFYLAAHEVTVGHFRQFVEESGYVTTTEKSDEGMVGWSPTPEDAPLYQSHDFQRSPDFNWKNPGFPQTDDHPVVGVSWTDAQAFCEWLSRKEGVVVRLPTEAEWELACRAGSQTHFYWGDGVRNTIHEYANIGNVELEKHREHAASRAWLLDLETEPEDGHIFTGPVGSLKPNNLGLFDMSGNVWEWCEDLFLDTHYNNWEREERSLPDKTAVDPVNRSEPQTDANQFRSIRGGSWYTGPQTARSSNRAFWDEGDAASYIGFRVLREVPASELPATNEAFEAELAALAAIEQVGGEISDPSRRDAYQVQFSQEGLTADIIRMLPDIGPVYHLELEGDAPIDAEILVAVSQLPDLEELVLSSNVKATPEEFSVLGQLNQLRQLRLPRVYPMEDAHLQGLSDLTTLEELSLHGTDGGLTDAGMRHLADNGGLTSLDLSEVDCSGAFLSDFHEAPLRSLTLRHRSGSPIAFEDTYASHLTVWADTLQSLTIESPALGNASMRAIAELTELRSLDLSGCTQPGDTDFAHLKSLLRLEDLDLEGTAAGDQALAAIAGRLDDLDTLRIGSSQLTDAGMKSISQLLTLEDLTVEEDAISVTDQGVRELERLRRLKNLRLRMPGIRGDGLAAVIDMPVLNDLTVTSPALTNVVFEHLSHSKSLRKIRLAEARRQPPSELTWEGMFRMRNLKDLEQLWLARHDTGIPEEKMLELNELMPGSPVIPYTTGWQPPKS